MLPLCNAAPPSAINLFKIISKEAPFSALLRWLRCVPKDNFFRLTTAALLLFLKRPDLGLVR